MNKLKLREVISAKVIYGELSDANNPNINPELAQFPVDEFGKTLTHSLEGNAYMEVSAGLSNIFKVVRVDLVKRLTHLNEEQYQVSKTFGVNGLGIRVITVFDF